MDKRILLYMIFLGLSFYIVQTYFLPKPVLQPAQEIISTSNISSSEKTKDKTDDEVFYVLENEYQQIVFSNLGGAISEINLPFKSKDTKSVVLPIEFDRLMEKAPQNDYYPQKSYYTFGFVKQNSRKQGGYYPLLRRSLYNNKGEIEHRFPSKYYALNIFDEEKSFSTINFKVTRFEKNLIQFEGKDENRTITKTYYFNQSEESPYMINLKLKITGSGKKLWLSTGIPEVEFSSNAFVPLLKYRLLSGSKYSIQNISLPKTENYGKGDYIDWISNSNGFFGIILDSVGDTKGSYITENIIGSKVPSRISLIDAKYNRYPADKYPGYNILMPFSASEEELNFRIFAGPYQDQILKALDIQYAKALSGYTPDYLGVKSSKGFFSFASEPFAKFLLLIMRLFYSLTHSWGFSIILLTIAFRIMLYPLNSWSIRSTMSMQEITPLLKVIDAKYKKDPKQANIEKMRLFKEKGANPLSGCLPILIQFPFLIGMFNLLKNTFELRGVSFIPGWIDNLTSPDILFSWNYPLFFIGTDFHLLPILLGIVMFTQSKMNANLPKDKKLLTDQQKQQIIMTWALPLLFTVLFYKAASGLNIYFFFSMLLGILQQWLMTKKKKEISLKLVKK